MSNPLNPSVLPVLRNLPTEHPRQPLLPGFKRRPFSPWPLLFLAALTVLSAMALWQWSAGETASAKHLAANGRIVQVERIGDGGAVQQTFVRYRFIVGNELVYGTALVSPQQGIYSVGDRVAVSYAPDAPQTSYIDSADISSGERLEKRIFFVLLPLFIFVWLASMFLLFSPTSPRDWLAWRRARGLYRNGELAAGRVQFVRPTSAFRSPNGRDSFEIVATYKVEGVRFVATTRCDNEWLVGQLAPETEVVVAHDPLKPERSVILEPFAF